MRLDLTLYHFDEISKNGYSLDMLFFLKMLDDGTDIKAISADNIKFQTVCQTLHRKGLISESYKITLSGKNLLSFIKQKREAPIVKSDNLSTTVDFDSWWKAYPGTDTFTYKDRSFSGSRSLRAGKDDCKLKLVSILSEGEYTLDEMIKALQFDVLQKKERSVETKINKLTYMQNSLTYLNQRSYEPFIELIKEGAVVKEESVHNGTDI